MWIASLPLWLVAFIVLAFSWHVAVDSGECSKKGDKEGAALAILILVVALVIAALVIAAAVYVGRL
jgi:hypothetical protein